MTKVSSHDPTQSMEEILQYLHLSPMFNFGQQQHFEDLSNDMKVFNNLAEHFKSYYKYGRKLCTELMTIKKLFDSIEFISKDGKFKMLLDSFQWAAAAFENHFHVVNNSIISQLNSYPPKQIVTLNEKSQAFQKALSDYYAYEDKYVSLSNTLQASSKESKTQKIQSLHGLLSTSFFDYVTKMEHIEMGIKTLVLDSVCTNLLNFH